MKAVALLSLVTSCALAVASCHGCRERRALVAELASTAGSVQRDQAASIERWQQAGPGAAFEVGDGLRTGARSLAELTLLPSGNLRVQADTVVRFAKQPPGAGARGRVELEAGAIELEATGADYEVSGPGGTARLVRGGRMHVRASDTAIRFEVGVGRVLLEEGGRTRELRAGDTFVLEVGAPSIETPPAAAAAPAPVDAGVQASAPAADDDGSFDTPPARADFELPAGESANVHDPSPPTHVRVAYGGCPADVALEITRVNGSYLTRVRGRGGAIAAVPTGHFRYRIRCAHQSGAPATRVAAEGRLQILRDAATRRLPNAPPAASVAADGRRYTVRYQNVAPKLTLRWPDAPRASSYVLTLRSGTGSVLRERAAAPELTLSSGRIAEGTYTFRFEADGKRSPEGTLSVVFDNTARIAYLSEPREQGFPAGAKVRLAGAALRGARLDVDGKLLPILGQGRFDTHVSAPVDRNALAVRVQHAATGVHYFLRHSVSSGE
jgi:hypothetical protein